MVFFRFFEVFRGVIFVLSILCLDNTLEEVMEKARNCRNLLASYPKLCSIMVSWVTNVTL